MSPVRIIVFAKAPLPGLAKTRLIPALGAEGAARLASAMLHATLTAALESGVGPVELCATPAVTDPAWRTTVIPADVECSDQGNGDLGARMQRAAARGIARGTPVLLSGTDCAEMSTQLLRDAAHALRQTGSFIHPTADGGYALLGLTRSDAALFERIAWSTSVVASVTMTRIRELGWPLHVGSVLHDIDEAADLHLWPHPEFGTAIG
ncbi:MAG: TIGR04282 family arsenosugar biosynthesis glycosyltransferase [Rhodocyclales bacterium]|nr:TIGR04282 family arsenosugar biosynthesis glycosyltransferase [Rhodocyclales bacterium]